ncbi:MAG: ferric reductase-like transmembrane domain-containing protein [Pseudomonadales bacterium]|nr:ferric reductase-like transmembrane domain-containing protein [Pseudomonadales bacterium]
MIKIPYWIKVHTLLVKYKQIILNIFLTLQILGMGIIVSGFYLFSNFTEVFILIAQRGNSLGTLALLLFLTTLLPGIFSRFKVFPLVGASIVLFRRQIGILMFIVAMIHSFYVSTIPAVMTGTFGPEFVTSREILGSLSLIILLPVWLTSNNISQKFFGKFWINIQRLTYFALIAIFAHVALTSYKSALIALIVLLLEIFSWMNVWFFSKKNNPSAELDS